MLTINVSPLHLDHSLISRISPSLNRWMYEIFNILDHEVVVAVENQAGRGS